MTTTELLLFIMFCLAIFIALALIYTSNKADERYEDLVEEYNLLAAENEELKETNRKLEIMNLVKSNLYPKEK